VRSSAQHTAVACTACMCIQCVASHSTSDSTSSMHTAVTATCITVGSAVHSAVHSAELVELTDSTMTVSNLEMCKQPCPAQQETQTGRTQHGRSFS
jgi:hypothetical protein